jgi:hypothetical protein
VTLLPLEHVDSVHVYVGKVRAAASHALLRASVKREVRRNLVEPFAALILRWRGEEGVWEQQRVGVCELVD